MYCVECFVGCFFGPRIIVAPIVDVSAAPTDRLASLAEPPKPNEVRGDPVQSVFQCELLSHVKYELYRSRDDLREGPFLVQGAFRVQFVGLSRGPLWAFFYDVGVWCRGRPVRMDDGQPGCGSGDCSEHGLIRQYLPKKRSMAHLTQHDCNRIATQLNTRPRKRLGYRTPEECYEP